MSVETSHSRRHRARIDEKKRERKRVLFISALGQILSSARSIYYSIIINKNLKNTYEKRKYIREKERKNDAHMKCKENRKSKRKRKIKTIKIYNIKSYYIDASVNKKNI